MLLLALCMLWVAPHLRARAESEAPDAPTRSSLEPGVLPTLAAAVPGFALHGAGTFLAKDRRTAKRLALSGAIGFATFFVSGALIAGTGTARRLVGATAPVLIAGAGSFFLGWLADIYGASTGGRDVYVAPFLSTIESEIGYRYVHDPQFRYGSFVDARAQLRAGSFRVSPSAIVALTDDNQRLSLELAHRLRGRRPGSASRDGSFVDVASALWYHRYGSERFAVWTPTLAFEGRLDLSRVGDSLRGAFVEGQVGAGLELYAFDASGARPSESAFGLLLARFAFGIYLGGRGAPRGGEATVYYDHRHDDFAAGLAVRGIAGGIAGHVGAAAHYYFAEEWGAGALLELGSAVVTSITLRYRRGRT